MVDVARCLAILAQGLHHRQEAELLVAAQKRGLSLRRVLMQDRNWRRQDLGILVAWQASTEQFVVIDVTGCGSPSRVSIDGSRQRLSRVDCAALNTDMLALATPQGRSIHASLAALALLVMLAAQALVLLVISGHPPGMRAALILSLAGLAWIVARVAYSIAASRASILLGWRRHSDLLAEILDGGVTILQSRTPHDYARAMRALLKNRVKTLRGRMALPMGLASLLPGLVALSISVSATWSLLRSHLGTPAGWRNRFSPFGGTDRKCGRAEFGRDGTAAGSRGARQLGFAAVGRGEFCPDASGGCSETSEKTCPSKEDAAAGYPCV